MAIRSHQLDVYDVELHLATNRRDWSTLRRRLPFLDKGAPESAGMSQLATWHPKKRGLPQPIVVLWVDLANHLTSSELVDTLAHEASHAAGQILDRVGHEVKGVDEPHAYLVGWLTRWLWDNVDRTGLDR